jgi:anti-sigma regulatory factor (Ser/Thr protein kinase)
MNRSVSLKAEKSDFQRLYDFIEETLETEGVAPNFTILLQMVSEELFTNIIQYGYESGGREKGVNVGLCVEGGKINLTFTDFGTPFDPLGAAEPDITLDVEDRPFGGLGIHMVKSSMDEVVYKRDGDRNVLKMTKNIEK